MMKNLVAIIILTTASLSVFSSHQHPSLLLTQSGVSQIREAKEDIPAFNLSLANTIAIADKSLESPIMLPQPLDGGGGASHERHKLNYYEMYNLGIAWQLTQDEHYANRVKDILLEYAKFYPGLGFHPVKLSKIPGRIFWQTLNESVWLVHTSIAYDCIYDYLTNKERDLIETNLFYPMADFLMNGSNGNRENNKVFNKMHNHATWATSAVGMIGLVMNDEDLVDRALYGSDKTGINGGFIKQLDYLFSPDGYFTEGAYYQRYAIWPFMLFAQSINNNMPELRIFEYRDSILMKAVTSLLELGYDGEFMQFNDAMEKGYDAQEVIYAVNTAYNVDPSNKMLLDVAQKYQDWVLPTDAGFRVAKDIAKGESRPMILKSTVLRDGRDGDEGAFVLLRSTDIDLNSAITLKATSHGLSHGHFDKLTLGYYDNKKEVLKDYGAARWHNIEAKYKGHYTPENKSFAMTTVAHNTLVVDQQSQFDGSYDQSMEHHSEILFSDIDKPDVQIVSSREGNAYEGVDMQRTVAYVTTTFLQNPLIVDVLKIKSEDKHQYDLPFWYGGDFISTNFPFEKSTNQMNVLGDKNGYQHLWELASGNNDNSSTSCFTWMNGHKFYSLNSLTSNDTEMIFVETGANDPNFNLRTEKAIIMRDKDAKDRTFFSTIETHGVYDVKLEQAANLTSSCDGLKILKDNDDYTIVEALFKGDNHVIICISNKNYNEQTAHRVETPEGLFVWQGPYKSIIK